MINNICNHNYYENDFESLRVRIMIVCTSISRYGGTLWRKKQTQLREKFLASMKIENFGRSHKRAVRGGRFGKRAIIIKNIYDFQLTCDWCLIMIIVKIIAI